MKPGLREPISTVGGSPSRGRLICFEGGDGAGKSTLAPRLAERLRDSGHPARFVSKKSTDYDDPFTRRRMETLSSVLWDYPKDAPVATWGDMHWYHLMVSWFSVLDACCVRPSVDRGEWIVVDNWYFKFLARFLAKPHFSKEHVYSGFRHISVPDDVVYVTLDPRTALDRRPDFSPSEAGVFDGRGGTSRGDFVDYQTTVNSHLDDLARSRAWIRVDHDTESDVAVGEICAAIVSRTRDARRRSGTNAR